MNREDFMSDLDDLRVFAWEYRDVILRAAKNESWDLVHNASPELVKRTIDFTMKVCNDYIADLNTAEDKCMLGLTLVYEDVLDEFSDRLQRDVLRYRDLMASLQESNIKHTSKARLRKSYIRD